MPGKQHVVAGRQATEYVILDHVVGFIFKEQIAFVLIHVHTQRTNFLIFQRFNCCLRINQCTATGIDDHHAIFHLIEGGFVQQMVVFRCQRAVQRDNV